MVRLRYERRQPVIDKNAAWCLNCDTVIESTHRHDFKRCHCEGEKGIFIDGGHDYQRMGFGKLSKFKVWGKDGWGTTGDSSSKSSPTTEEKSSEGTDGSK